MKATAELELEAATWSNGPWDIPPHTYHDQNDYISHSTLEVMRQSEALYNALYVAKTEEPPEPTGPMEFGSAFHNFELEAPGPGGWRFRVGPNCGRTAAAFKQFQTQHYPEPCVTEAEYDLMTRMNVGIARNEMASMLVRSDGLVEQMFRWIDPETGLRCRMKCDKLFPNSGLVIDLKTCKEPSPSAFAKDCANYGYHRQAAFYLAGLRACGFDVTDFYFIACGKEGAKDCAVHKLSERDLAMASHDNEADMRRLKACYESGVWNYRWAREINVIDLPPWAYDRE
jgi:hypothetical protein